MQQHYSIMTAVHTDMDTAIAIVPLGAACPSIEAVARESCFESDFFIM